MNRRLLCFCIIGFFPLFAHALPNQGEGALLKKKLCKGWQYQKCRIMGVEYSPKKEEANDQFLFHSDMTFTITEEGITKSGNWKVIDEEEQTISLAFSNGSVKQLKVEQVNQDVLVYTIMADWQYDVTIYMQAKMPQEPMQANGLSNFQAPNGGISLHSLLFP